MMISKLVEPIFMYKVKLVELFLVVNVKLGKLILDCFSSLKTSVFFKNCVTEHAFSMFKVSELSKCEISG